MNIHDIYRRVSPLFRKRRFDRFLQALSPQAEDRILDVGGYPGNWQGVAIESRLTILNLHEISIAAKGLADRYELVVGDGTKLIYADKTFDIVFSNSVIEHLGTSEKQKAFAAEVRRVGKKLWIQTPARCFLIEPHLIAPLVHFFPKAIQRRLIRHCTVWGWLKKPTAQQVEAFLSEVRLLSRREMVELFPDCEIIAEKVLGLTKSYVAIRC
jgi:SAM-dependent methyltransferase